MNIPAVLLGALLGMLSTGLLAAITTSKTLANVSARLASVEETLKQISYVRVKHRRNDYPNEEN